MNTVTIDIDGCDITLRRHPNCDICFSSDSISPEGAMLSPSTALLLAQALMTLAEPTDA